MKERKKPLYILARFEGRWELWENSKNGWTARHPTHIENIQGNGVVILPTHVVHCLHVTLHSTNPAEFEKLIPFQIEAKGLTATTSSFAYDILSQKDGKSLLLVNVLDENRCDPKLFKRGTFFEIFPKNFPLQPDALTLWKEDSLFNIAVTKESKLVYFQSLTADDLGDALYSEIRLISWQLSSLNLFPEPHQVVIWSHTSPDEKKMQEVSTQLDCKVEWQKKPTPILPESFSNLSPQYVLQERKKIHLRAKWKWAGIAAGAALALFIGILSLHIMALALEVWKLESEQKQLQPSLEMIQSAMKEWKSLGAAVDAQRSPIGALIQINQSLPAEGIRLLQFNSDDTAWSLEAEAQNISLATTWMEQIKKNASFKDYQWETPQPQIFNSLIRFKMKAIFYEAASIQ